MNKPLIFAMCLVIGALIGTIVTIVVTPPCPTPVDVQHEVDSLRAIADKYHSIQQELQAEADRLKAYADSVVASQPDSVVIREQLDRFRYAPLDSIRAALMAEPT